MNPVIATILQDTVPTVVVKSLKHVSSKSFNKNIENILIHKTDFEFIIDQKILLEDFPEIEVKPLAQFLKSEDVELIVQQIYNPNLIHNGIDEIRNEFCLSFSRNFDVEISLCNSVAANLFEILIEGCKITLDKAMSQGLISAHDAKTQFRFNLVEDKLDKIRDDVKDIKEYFNTSSSEKHVNENYDAQIENYLNQILNGKLCPNINVLYTELSLLEKPVNIYPLLLKAKSENKPAEFEISELVEKESKLIISGDSGSGKTTTLRWLTYTSAKKCLEEKNPYIPIYVELNNYVEGSFHNYVITCAKEYGLSEKVTKELLEAKIKDKSIILLIDGLDLLTDTKGFTPYTYISHFITGHPSCRYIISSRPGFFDRFNKKDFKISEIQELSKEKIASFIDRYVGDKKEIAKVIKNEILNNEKFSLFTNPMMLFIAINIAFSRRNEETILPPTRAKLYKEFIDLLFNHYNKKGKKLNSEKFHIEDTAKHLFFAIQSENKMRWDLKSALKIAENKCKEIDDICGIYDIRGKNVLDDLFNLGILEKDGDFIKYGIHQSFQEYFAASRLQELFDEGIDISQAFTHPKWEETVIFASEMVENSDDFVKKIIKKKEFELASKCSKNISSELKSDFCNQLYENRNSQYSHERIIVVRSLGNLKDIDHLTFFVEDNGSRVRTSLAEVLGDIKSDEVIKTLSLLIEDKSEYVSESALYSLSTIGSRKAIRSLFDAMKLEDDYITENVIVFMDNVQENIDSDLLFEGLADSNIDLKISCIFLIGDICFSNQDKCDLFIDSLIPFLSDNNSDVREAATRSLIYMCTDEAVNAVENALIHGNYEIKESIIDSINEFELAEIISINAVISTLNSILQSATESDKQVEIIHLLGMIESDEVTKILVDLLNTGSICVKEAVIDYLPFDLDDNSIEIIVNLLKTKNFNSKLKTIKYLGNTQSKSALVPLKELVNDKSLEVQEMAILSLCKIDSEYLLENGFKKWNDYSNYAKVEIITMIGKLNCEKAANHLINTLKERDSLIRLESRNNLIKMTFDGLDELLLESLQNKNDRVKESVAIVLGEKAYISAIDSLINIIDNEKKEDYARIAAARSLGMIGDEKAVHSLLKLACSTNSEIKIASISALRKIKSEISIDVLLDKLKDPSPNVAISAIDALSEFKNQRIFDALLDLFTDELDSDIKYHLAWTYNKLKLSEAFNPLLLASEKSDSLWFECEWILKELCTAKHKRILENHKASDNLFIADFCSEMLNELKREELMEKPIFK